METMVKSFQALTPDLQALAGGNGFNNMIQLVNALRSEQVWPSNVSNCPQS